MREWQSKAASQHSPADFVLPIFLLNHDDKQEEIQSMPGGYN
jgi:delta-aminolevulinic acid dehydratase/porphobilinogen synthase